MRETNMPDPAKHFNQFLAEVPNLYSLNTLKEQKFSHIFRGYKVKY